MDDLFWSAPLGAIRTLCVSTLSHAALAECEVKAFGSDFGYFVYEVDERPRSAGISVLAKATSEDAAVRLAEILALRLAADAAAPPLTAV